MVDTVVPTGQTHAELCRDRFTDWSAETQRLSHRLKRYVKNKKILIFGVIGFALIDPAGGARGPSCAVVHHADTCGDRSESNRPQTLSSGSGH